MQVHNKRYTIQGSRYTENQSRLPVMLGSSFLFFRAPYTLHRAPSFHTSYRQVVPLGRPREQSHVLEALANSIRSGPVLVFPGRLSFLDEFFDLFGVGLLGRGYESFEESLRFFVKKAENRSGEIELPSLQRQPGLA